MTALRDLLIPVYVVGDLVTWVVLVVQDWRHISGWRFLLSALVFDLILAQIWPLYWLILRPLMGS